MPSLEVIAGINPNEGETFDLKEGVTTIGTNENNTIVIKNKYAARFHARIVLEGGDCTIYDLESRNGTHVNGQKIEQGTLLGDGDKIKIGLHQFEFRDKTQSVLDEPPQLEDESGSSDSTVV